MNGRLTAASLLLIACCIITGCTQAPPASASLDDPWGVIALDPGQPIRIAVALTDDETSVGAQGLEQRRGAELAVARRPSIRGFPVEAVLFDAGCSAEEGQSTAGSIILDESIAAVVGHTCSVSCQPAAALYEDAHLVSVSPSCSASTLTDEVLHTGSFLRTIYDDALEGDLAGRFAYLELGARRVIVLGDGTLDTQDVIAAFEASFTRQGGQIIHVEQVAPGQTSFRPLLIELTALRPDLIYAPLQAPSAAALARQLQATALTGTPLLGGRAYRDDWFIQEAGLSANGVYAAGPLVQGAAYDALQQAYRERYGRPPSGSVFAFSYDATALILQAVEETSVLDGQRRLLIGRQALRDRLYATASYPGVTGSLTCTAWGDCSAGSLAVWQVRNNRWISIYVP